ncbi:MAG: hypothetical protein ACR2P2_15765 [Nakamurella sp.]
MLTLLPSYLVVAALLTMAALGEDNWPPLPRVGSGGAALFAFYFATAFAYRRRR